MSYLCHTTILNLEIDIQLIVNIYVDMYLLIHTHTYVNIYDELLYEVFHAVIQFIQNIFIYVRKYI
jgi:hypothetical protein